MSAPSFLNLPQYRVLKLDEDEHDYHVYVEPAKPVKVCRHCGSVEVAKWGGNWNVEILNHFEHGVTNAYTESLNSLIRVVNRMGRGYSFEALRAKMLFTEGLHKVARPKFERRPGNGISAFMQLPGDALGMMTLDELFGEPSNYGTDISTLARRIESGQF